jgi:S-adenosyl methyltransferase
MTCTNTYYPGKDNFAADRELGDRTLQAYPNLVYSVRANRAFLARAVRFLAAEEGIRQFLDIGTGIPTANNTHEVAQRGARRPDRLRRQRPLQVGLCTRALDRSGDLKRTRERKC